MSYDQNVPMRARPVDYEGPTPRADHKGVMVPKAEGFQARRSLLVQTSSSRAGKSDWPKTLEAEGRSHKTISTNDVKLTMEDYVAYMERLFKVLPEAELPVLSRKLENT